MNSNQQVVVVYADRASEPALEEAIRSEGYEVQLAPSAEDLPALIHPDRCAAITLLTGGQASANPEDLLLVAAEVLPGGKYVVHVPNGEHSPQDLSKGFGEDQVLWMTGDLSSPSNIHRLRRFLQGEGYRWAREVDGSGGRDVSLLETAPSPGRTRGQASKLQTFVRNLAEIGDLGEMLQEALRRYLEVLKCDAGSIYLWDERTETLILEAAEGPESEQRIGIRQKMGEGLAGWVAQAQESILVSDTRKVHKLRGRQCDRYPDFSCLAAPIAHAGQLFGVVCLTMQREERPFDRDDLRLIELLSQRLGSLIRPLSFMGELRSFNERLLEVLRSCSDLVVEKDTQVESIRAQSSDILDSIPIAVVAYDRHLRVRSANVAARELLGLSPNTSGEAANPPLVQGLEVDPSHWRRKLLDVVEGGGEFRLQRVVLSQEDRRRILDVHCSPLHDSEASTVGGILTVQDVTEDVEMEEKLSSAQRLALMGKLAAKVAHELNNPLDGILRFMNLAVRKMEERPKEAEAHLEECRRGLLRMGNILTQLLAFSRGHRAAGRPTSLSQVVRDALTLYEQRAREAGVQVEMDIPSDLPPSESGELCDVFGNVIKNALDAMPEGGVLGVSARQGDSHVVIRFSDTGGGVPAEIRDKIFEPFFTTKRSGTGTGLGLAACRDSLNRIGGAIRLRPSDNGAVFEIEVPVKQQME